MMAGTGWIPYAVLLIGLLDAALIIAVGLLYAALTLLGRDTTGFWRRLGPAIGILLSTNLVGACILLATRYFVSL